MTQAQMGQPQVPMTQGQVSQAQMQVQQQQLSQSQSSFLPENMSLLDILPQWSETYNFKYFMS